MAREGGEDRQFLIYLFIYSNKLAYLQLWTDLVFRSSPPKSHEQGYLNFKQKPGKIRVNEFIFRTYNFTKNYLKWLTLLKKITRKYFSKIFVQKFQRLVLQNTLYICIKKAVHGLSKIIQNYVNNKINN